jgi:D-alanyl-D-alanine-carboxypeptidase/D-alanyl-D-alanine-endopeptidase
MTRDMKRRIGGLSFSAILLASCVWLFLQSAGGAETNGEVSALKAPAGFGLTERDIASMLRDYVEVDKLGVGLVVGIIDQQGSHIVSHGRMDDGTDREVDGDTLFHIGSITKVFTALLLQDMVDRGEMKLEDPVQKYLPDGVKLPTYQGKQITLLHLATHTSSLPRDGNADFYSSLTNCTLRWTPGTRQEYSNLGMALLGHVIALRAGVDYGTLVVDRICRPLGMNSTRVDLTPDLRTRLAMGHAMPGRRVQGIGISLYPGAGALSSTVNDLLKFVAAYSGLVPTPLSPVMQRAQAPHPSESGEKRRLVWDGDGSVFEHGGLLDGYQAELAFDIKTRRGVVVLSNCANWSTLLPEIWRPLLEDRSPRPAECATPDPKLFDRYVGRYRTKKQTAILCVRRDGECLRFQWFDEKGDRWFPSYEMFPQSDLVFCNEFWTQRATFRGTSGGRTELTLNSLLPKSDFEPLNLWRISTNVFPVPEMIPSDAVNYEGCVGQFRKTILFGLIRLGPTLNISYQKDDLGKHLFVYVKDYGRVEIFPTDKDAFIPGPTVGDELRLTFLRNEQGKATHVAVRWNGSNHRGSRISDQPLK